TESTDHPSPPPPRRETLRLTDVRLHVVDWARARNRYGFFELRNERRLVHLRLAERRPRQSDDGPLRVVRLRDRLCKRLRPTGHERQIDIDPIVCHRVVDNRPSLQERRFVVS